MDGGMGDHLRRKLRIKNAAVAAGLTAFVAGVYVYTMRAVGGTDELQAAVEVFEKEQKQQETSTQPQLHVGASKAA